MKITPTTLTISQLFSSSNEQFFIPAYQRRYSWQWKQIAELYDDIDLLKENDTHLLGSIVCLTSNHTAGINTLELVDGQQRITSLSIFLKAIRDRFLDLGEKDVVTEIDSYLYCKGIDRKPINKVLLGDLDNPDYEKLVKQTKLDEIKNAEMLNAYEYLKEWVDELDLSKLNILYFKFINNVILVRLDVGDAKDAYKLFETINNRGLKLCPTDIIKNFLLGHASSINNDVLTEVRENWKQLIVNLDEVNTDDFFRQLMCGRLQRKITFTYLIDEFKKYYLRTVEEAKELPEYEIYNEYLIENEETVREEIPEENGNGSVEDEKEKQKTVTIVDYSEELKSLSLLYKKILKRKFENIKINRHLFNLQRIKSFPSYVFLLNLFDRADVSEKQIIEILSLLETFMLRRHICEYRTGELDDIFSKLVKVDSQNIVEKVKEELKKDLPTDKEFEIKFSTASFKGNENRAKYVIEKFEYDKINDAGEYVLNSGNELHLEHIIPKTIDTKKSKKEFGDWITYLGKDSLTEHKHYVNRVGNFTLLGQKLNISASNNPFKSKLTEYEKSNIAMTKEIFEDYEDFRFEEVEKRSKDLAKRAKKLWRIK